MIGKELSLRLLELLIMMVVLSSSAPASDLTEPSSEFLSDGNYPDRGVQRIAFGSCNKPKRSQEFWNVIAEKGPDLMLLLGDNHYAESTDPKKLKRAYDQLATIPQYKDFRLKIPIFATWDNHDYGAKYPGRLHPHAEQSEQLFLEHFSIPKADVRQQRIGIYATWVFGSKPHRIQIILLDLQRFRDPLQDRKKGERFAPQAGKTVMGAEQWAWFEEQLKVDAEIRMIGSGIQVLSNEHSWRRWGMFPDDRERLLRSVDDATGTTVFLSGDRHRGEISVMDPSSEKPLCDITASSFNLCYPGSEKNRFRVGGLIEVPHFGLLDVDWKNGTITMQLLSAEDGTSLLERTLLMKRDSITEQAEVGDAPKP